MIYYVYQHVHTFDTGFLRDIADDDTASTVYDRFEYDQCVDHVAKAQMAEYRVALKYLWNLQSVQNAWSKRGQHYIVMDNMKWWFDRIDRVLNPDWTPNEEESMRMLPSGSNNVQLRYDLNVNAADLHVIPDAVPTSTGV